MNNIKLKNSLNLKFFCEIKGDNYKIDVTDCVYKKCLYFDSYIYIITFFTKISFDGRSITATAYTVCDMKPDA